MTQLADSRPERHHDLDWLRALVILNLFLFHAALYLDVANNCMKRKNCPHGL